MRPIVKIDEAPPAPPKKRGSPGIKPEFPILNKIEVGGSFTVAVRLRDKIRRAIAWCSQKNGKKFSYRTESDRVRVWRIE